MKILLSNNDVLFEGTPEEVYHFKHCLKTVQDGLTRTAHPEGRNIALVAGYGQFRDWLEQLTIVE